MGGGGTLGLGPAPPHVGFPSCLFFKEDMHESRGKVTPSPPHVSPISSRLHPHLENSRRFGASLGLNLQPPRAPTHSCKRPHNCSHPQNRPVRWEQASLCLSTGHPTSTSSHPGWPLS